MEKGLRLATKTILYKVNLKIAENVIYSRIGS